MPIKTDKQDFTLIPTKMHAILESVLSLEEDHTPSKFTKSDTNGVIKAKKQMDTQLAEA